MVAANRDAPPARPSQPPGRHWPDWPEVIAGLDGPSGGTWLGVNDHGLLAAVLERDEPPGSGQQRRGRGELVLEALDHAEAQEAAGALADLHPDAYAPFNLVLADPRRAYWLRHGGDGAIRVHPIPDGLHMLASTELDDSAHPRVRRFLPRFRNAAAPVIAEDAARADLSDWIVLLQARDADPDAGVNGAMNVQPLSAEGAYATVASSLIALPTYPGFEQRVRWWHAHGAPDEVPFLKVET
jgi:uncharacterized protein with NRDE domain